MKHTDEQLMQAHIAMLSGTYLNDYAKMKGYNYGLLSKQLKAWRKRNDTKAKNISLSSTRK